MPKTNLQKLVLQALDDIKAQDIIDLDIKKLTSMADRMIICTGTSSRHVAAIADKVIVTAKEHGFKPIGKEGEAQAEWILIDLGDIIVHVMQAETREFYSLEKLWTAPITAKNTTKSKAHAD